MLAINEEAHISEDIPKIVLFPHAHLGEAGPLLHWPPAVPHESVNIFRTACVRSEIDIREQLAKKTGLHFPIVKFCKLHMVLYDVRMHALMNERHAACIVCMPCMLEVMARRIIADETQGGGVDDRWCANQHSALH